MYFILLCKEIIVFPVLSDCSSAEQCFFGSDNFFFFFSLWMFNLGMWFDFFHRFGLQYKSCCAMYILHGILLSQKANEHEHLGFIGNGLLNAMLLQQIQYFSKVTASPVLAAIPIGYTGERWQGHEVHELFQCQNGCDQSKCLFSLCTSIRQEDKLQILTCGSTFVRRWVRNVENFSAWDSS